jgi:hypothetical protein
MSRFKPNKCQHAQVIAVDSNFLPMMEIPRRKAIKAVATGRAMGLDPHTWSRQALEEVDGQQLTVIIFTRTKMVSDGRLGFGRNNRAILRRDEFVCQYDDCTRKATTIDHVVPRCQGGLSTWHNQVACCLSCNQRKAGRTPEQAGMKLKHPVRSPRFHLMQRFQRATEAVA